ncbi:MAG: electron transfer flavoprotein subunit beta/FixA family protein [Candidatus Rokubacteria bacterium]|nr:electron transfer flavoprotein subunit beta/FixA family protein [Candidatus Rokubacteria bacterium]
MRPLDIIVCVKVVPKPEEVSVNPETRTIDRARARSELNPPDMNAIELALALRERYGGTVSLLSMGPPLAGPCLQIGLAMGADRAFLLSDRAFGGADTLATTYALAKAIERIGVWDLVLCGEESSDGATGQVPQGIAEWLGVAQITYATELSVREDGRLVGEREIRGGREVVAAPLPAVVSVKLGINEPRFMDMDYRRSAQAVTTWTAGDLGLDGEWLGFKGSPTVVADVWQAKGPARRREFLEGSPVEAARLLLERIRPLLGGMSAPSAR